MLTARNDETDRIVGLEIGADDYVAKPFHLRELLARIGSILRRVELDRGDGPQLIVDSLCEGDLSMDRVRREVQVSDCPIELTTKEFDLLWLLARHPGRVFSRSYLLEWLWERTDSGSDRSVDNCILRIRRKLGRDTEVASRIQSVWGIGYRLAARREAP